jgi:hypothetical protein
MRKVFWAALLAVAAPLFLSSPLGAGTAVRFDVTGLVDEADLVFEGRVLSLRPMTDAKGRVLTEVFVSVQQTWWGTPYGTQVFRVPGGILPDGSGMLIPGMPTFSQGEDAIFFLSQQGKSGIRVPVGLAQGKMTVTVGANGERRLVREQVGLAFVNQESGVVTPAEERAVMDYATVTGVIEAAALSRRLRAKGGR